MSKIWIKFLFLFIFLAASVVVGQGGESTQVSFPEAYRTWPHVKSMVIQPGHPLENPFQGLHHVYANPKALEGLKSGTYPDGAVLVFDLLQYHESDHTVTEQDRKLIGVMQRDAKKFAATGGWGFEGFGGGQPQKRLTTDGGQSCFGCHQAKKEEAFVFSKWRG